MQEARPLECLTLYHWLCNMPALLAKAKETHILKVRHLSDDIFVGSYRGQVSLPRLKTHADCFSFLGRQVLSKFLNRSWIPRLSNIMSPDSGYYVKACSIYLSCGDCQGPQLSQYDKVSYLKDTGFAKIDAPMTTPRAEACPLGLVERN